MSNTIGNVDDCGKKNDGDGRNDEGGIKFPWWWQLDVLGYLSLKMDKKGNLVFLVSNHQILMLADFHQTEEVEVKERKKPFGDELILEQTTNNNGGWRVWKGGLTRVAIHEPIDREGM